MSSKQKSGAVFEGEGAGAGGVGGLECRGGGGGGAPQRLCLSTQAALISCGFGGLGIRVRGWGRQPRPLVGSKHHLSDPLSPSTGAGRGQVAGLVGRPYLGHGSPGL